MAKVVLENLTKYFDEVVAVKDFNLEIEDKEFVVLVGPSGCGKTTTLRMVAGLEEPTEGRIYIGDRMVNYLPPKDRDIAMVFQNYALYPHMSVYNNMAFGLKLRGFAKKEIDRRVQEAAEILGILDLLHRKPRALSGGQRQRVAVGRAIVRKPQVFLFDEPLSNLDAKLRVQMRVELKRLHERLNATVIYVTHDQLEAMTLGDRIVVMKDGLIQQVGEPLKVYSHPTNLFVAGFIGSPAMNFVKANILYTDGRLFLDAPSFRLLLPADKARKLDGYRDQKVIFGIRPEDLLEAPEGKGEDTLEALVEVIEPIGSEVLLNVKIGPDNLVAKVNPSTQARVSQKIWLKPVLENMHIFHIESEQAIL